MNIDDVEALLNNEVLMTAIAVASPGYGPLVVEALKQAITVNKMIMNIVDGIENITDEDIKKDLYEKILLNMPVEQKRFMEEVINNQTISLKENRFINTNWI